MDAHSSAPLRIAPPVLVALCVVAAIVGSLWTAWDMFGAHRRSMLQGWDDSFYYFWLPSVVIDHDVDFSNQVTHGGTLPPSAQAEAFAQPLTPAGLMPNKYPPGWALGSLPFFLLAHAVAPAGATGFESGYLLAVWLGQLLYAAAGLWLAVKIVGRYFPEPIASVAVLAIWLASPLLYYQTSRLFMSHSQVFVLTMAVFWLALRIHDGDTRARFWLLLGLGGAALVITRNLAAVYLILPAVVLVRRLRSLPALGWLMLGAAGPLVVQLIAWKLLFGSWFIYSYGGERFDFTHLHLAEVLFSPRHGWFYWHPLLLIALVPFIARSVRSIEGRAWLASLGAIVLLNAAWPMWWLGSSFGQRGFEAATFFAMLGFAWWLRASATRAFWRRLLIGVTAAAIVWNALLFALFLSQRISREEPVTYVAAVRALAGWIGNSR
jgi:hypothetical protein